MADTRQVVTRLDLQDTNTKLLAIVANMRGAAMACDYEQITYVGFPFSISEIFQQRNTNASQDKAFRMAVEMHDLCTKHKKKLVLYLSMGFGNPYGEMWHPALVEHWTDRFASIGIKTISLSDTIGIAQPEQITDLFTNLTYAFPNTEFGVHLHSEPHNWLPKVAAAYQSGCRRFDGALSGFGGCPMAQNNLVGNIATENLIAFMQEHHEGFLIEQDALKHAQMLSIAVFNQALVPN